jgi:hypothetical protein
MKKMAAGKFKAASGESGARDGEESGLSGFMRGEFKIIGDIESPVFPAKRWKKTKK